MKRFDRSKITNFKSAASVAIATAGGAGFFPVAPGTMGTLVAMPLAYFTIDWSPLCRVLLWTAVMLLGTWAAKVFDETMQSHDNQHIVIDEVLGLGITAFTVGHSPLGWALAFILFRILDVLKLPPARQMDRLSKNGSPWLTGFGVMADDLVAGFQGLLILWSLQRLGWL